MDFYQIELRKLVVLRLLIQESFEQDEIHLWITVMSVVPCLIVNTFPYEFYMKMKATAKYLQNLHQPFTVLILDKFAICFLKYLENGLVACRIYELQEWKNSEFLGEVMCIVFFGLQLSFLCYEGTDEAHYWIPYQALLLNCLCKNMFFFFGCWSEGGIVQQFPCYLLVWDMVQFKSANSHEFGIMDELVVFRLVCLPFKDFWCPLF